MTSAPAISDLARVAQASRAALLQRDAALLTQLRAYYAVARRDLIRDLDRLVAQVEAARATGQEISQSWLQRQTRYRSLIEQIDSKMAGYGDYAAPRIEAAQTAAAHLGIAHAGQMLNAAGVDASFNRLPVKAIEEIAGTLADGSPLRAYFDAFGPKDSQAGREILVSGLVRGKNPRAVAPALMRALDSTAVSALTTARSSTLNAYRTASTLSYQANADVLSGHRWLCAKSSRTCLNCLSRDGTLLDLDEFMPVHLNCRCTTIPVVKGVAMPPIQTGSEWFDAQDDSVKQEMMGRAAFDLFKQDKIALADFKGYRTNSQWGPSTYQRSLKEILG